jgi:hypothetical protein
LFFGVPYQFVEFLCVRASLWHTIRPQRLLKFRGGLLASFLSDGEAFATKGR